MSDPSFSRKNSRKFNSKTQALPKTPRHFSNGFLLLEINFCNTCDLRTSLLFKTLNKMIVDVLCLDEKKHNFLARFKRFCLPLAIIYPAF